MIPQLKAESSAKKILIAGAFATGKTTLAKKLIEALAQKGIPAGLVTAIARRSPFALNREQTPLATAWLIGEQMRSEIEAMVREPFLVICDRGIPDFISHTLVLKLRASAESNLADSMIEIGRLWRRTYDAVFWAKLDPDRPIEPAGGVRVTEKEYQQELEHSIGLSFTLLGIDPIPLPSTTEDRVKIIMPHIFDMLTSARRGVRDML